MKILKVEFFTDSTEAEATAIKAQVDACWPGRITRVFERERGPKRLA